MKKTKLSMFLFFLQLLAFLIVPVVFVWLQYSDEIGEVKFKVPFTVIMLLLTSFLVTKKLFFDKHLQEMNNKLSTIETNALTTTDSRAIKSLKREYRWLSALKLVIDLFIPAIALVIFLKVIEAVEAGIIKLYGALMFCCISFAVGVVIRFISIFTAKLEHEVKDEK